MLSLYFAPLPAFTPNGALTPSFSSVRRSGPPVLNLQQRAQTGALAAALAATISVNAASAADPWPYSTLISKVQNDDVAKFSATMERQTDGKWLIVHNHRGTGQSP